MSIRSQTMNLIKESGSITEIDSLTPNQSLKLTEPAVDDFARAKQPVTCWT